MTDIVKKLRLSNGVMLDAGPDADWDEHEKRVRKALGEKI